MCKYTEQRQNLQNFKCVLIVSFVIVSRSRTTLPKFYVDILLTCLPDNGNLTVSRLRLRLVRPVCGRPAEHPLGRAFESQHWQSCNIGKIM